MDALMIWRHFAVRLPGLVLRAGNNAQAQRTRSFGGPVALNDVPRPAAFRVYCCVVSS
jgi:hypothetical protein